MKQEKAASQPTKPTAHECAEKGDIREYWINEYVRENYKKLGFSKIEGPFDFGPDFKAVFEGMEVIVEVERTCELYIKHGHHKDPRFRGTNVLVVLSSFKPPKDIKKKLPKTIIHIDVEDFVEWYRRAAKGYRKFKEFQGLRNLRALEIKKIIATSCGSKDRDMSTCPECELCPYFGEGADIAPSLLFDLLLPTMLRKFSHRRPKTRNTAIDR